MTRQVSTRFFVLIGLVIAGLAGAVVGRRPELAAATAPFLALLLVGCSAHRWPDVTVVTRPERGRAIEGDTIDLLVDVTASRPVPWLDLELALPPSLEPVDGSDRALVTIPEAGTRTVAFPVRARRWGVASPERTLVVARDRFGLFARSRVASSHAPVRVYPAEGQLAAMLAPRSTGRSLGTHRATARGEGCEFADVRPYQPGDRPRSLNWRVSARRGEPWVTERHPELATDLVVLLDAGTEVGSGDDTTLRRAIRAAMALAETHVGGHDRVGLCALGGRLHWLAPRLGRHQLYRIVDALLECQGGLAAPGGTGVAGALAAGGPSLPLRGLAPGTSIVALSPLLDRRVIDVLAELRRRELDVVVVETSAEARLAAATRRQVDPAARLARRVWSLEREAVRRRLLAIGIPVVTWDDEQPLAGVLELLGRRRWRAAGGRPAGASR